MLRLAGRYCVRMEEMKDEVEPLPLVPAMWTGFKRSKSEGCRRKEAHLGQLHHHLHFVDTTHTS